MNLGDLFCLNPELTNLATRSIKEGQVLNVLSCPRALRAPSTTPKAYKSVYTARAGDTAASIGGMARLNTSIAAVLVANPWIQNPGAQLPAGRKVCIL